MKTSPILFFILLIISIFSCDNPDTKSVLDQYNVVWQTQSENSAGSMPLVGGDMGCNVWMENDEVLVYVQRSGSLSENGAYLKMGRVRLQMSPNPLAGASSFRQELKLKDGYIEIKSAGSVNGNLTLRLWVDVFHPVLHLEVESEKPVEVTAAYENWRTEDRELLPREGSRRERFTCFSLEGYPGRVFRVKDEISFRGESVLFYHRNPEQKLNPDLFIKQQGLEEVADEIFDDLQDRTFGGVLLGEGFIAAGRGEGHYRDTPFKSWKLKSGKSGKKHHISLVTHIGQAETVDDWKEQLMATVAEAIADPREAFRNSVDWWHRFWDRSHIFIHPEKEDRSDPVWQMSRNYQLFRYQLGGNVHGEYPTKFNGGNLVYDPVLISEEKHYDPDWRQWGGAVHTAQNQRLLYWPMLKSGDFDAMIPQFDLYRKGLPGATARVKAHFGHKGAVFSEYMNASGVVFGAGWGWDGDGYRARGTEIPFGDPRANGARGYNDLAEEGVMANQSCAYHWESQLEYAYMMLEYHRFTGKDISAYMPFIKASVVFFDEHYQLRQQMRDGRTLDENGKLVIYPSTSCESYRGATNPTDIIAGLNACLKGLLQLDDRYATAEEKSYYRSFLSRIPDYPFDNEQDLPTIKPAYSWLKEANQELPQFYPLFPFNQFQLGDEEIQAFQNAYRLAPAFRKGTVQSWHQDGIQFARMGMTGEAAEYNTQKLQDSPRRYPTFWGPGHDWVPDHNWGGSGMIGLQEMLMQTVGEKIVLFPAWPKTWDVDFKLHAPGNTTVEVVLNDGEITALKVTPASRSQDITVALKEDSPPNILFILIDDMGWKDISCAGSKYFETPNIDELASAGKRFLNAYSPAPVCTPTRGAIFSGKCPARTQLTTVFNGPAGPDSRLHDKSKYRGENDQYLEARHRHALPETEVIIPQALAEAGYKTAFFGKWHIGECPGYYPDERGFHVARGYRNRQDVKRSHWMMDFAGTAANMTGTDTAGYVADVMTDQCVEFIAENRYEPWMAVLSHYLVHNPIQPKPEKLARYEDKETSDQNHPGYAAMVESVDESVGRLIRAIRELGLEQNTMVIFTSDNGGLTPNNTSNYPLMGGKSFPFEAGMKVPFIVKWPGKIEPGIAEERIIGMDVYPTLLRAAGLPLRPEQHVDGVDLMPLLTQGEPLKDRPIIFHFPHYTHATGPFSSIIEKDWKLIRFYNDEAGGYLLYDLAIDPQEQQNLAHENIEMRDRLLRRLESSLQEMKAELPVPNPDYEPDNAAVKKNLKFTRDLAEKEREIFEERLSKSVSY